MTGFDPAFRLIDPDGVRAASELPDSDDVVDVATQGAAGVISALTGSSRNVWLIRDPLIGLSESMGEGLWLQTSGTTGPPKWVRHDPETLWSRIAAGRERVRWLLTYHPGSFAGVQVILSALKGGHDLVAAPIGADIAELTQWAVAHQVTHISGTPTFWRAFVMALSGELPLQVATLGGETADQGILDAIRTKFPEAHIKHIYATTEAGVVFTVSDAREGFPAYWLNADSRLSLTSDNTLCINGVDSGDVIALEGDRALFQGRLDSVVNIGGTKVFPETVEAFLLRHEDVLDARVSARPSPITGYVLMAEVVAREGAVDVGHSVKTHLSHLPRAQRPVVVRFVAQLATTQTGKKARMI